ncbi:MAG: aspartate aminotransferase family protein [Clostridiales bacterium]|nr:aspartate aminotransferase family protein [Clostridiales bacterium]
MSEAKKVSRTEGDVNISDLRAAWQEKFIDAKTKEMLDEDAEYFIHQALSTPCMNMVSGVEGIYLVDSSGRKYMDFHGNSVHQLGYNHPYLLDAMRKQLDELSFSPRRYANETATRLAKKLCSLMPSKYRVLFSPGGAESVGIALKIVRKATGKYKTISLWDSFHGATLDAISVGGEGHFRTGIGPLLPGCEHVMPYNSYRGLFGEGVGNALKYAEYIEYVCHCEGDIGAILLEPIRCTDVQVPPPEYYRKIREICDKYGVALIFDEIPTGFGRTGKMFAFQNYDVEPDMLVLGKGLGGSLFPISAVLAKEKYNVCGDISLGHYTHEKSPLGCAVGYALIEFIEEKDVLGHVAKLSALLERRLAGFMDKFEGVGDVRLIGALCGIELVKDRKTKEKDLESAERVLYECLENGLSFKVSQGNVLTLAPPLVITEEELERAMDIVESALRKFIKMTM